MVLAKRVGTILKEAREAKKLAIRDVARETNIIPRYIEALENEDYSSFPGETYALGFLSSYADYLGLDTEHLLNLYRGLQIDQSQAPLVELTKPTNPLNMIDRRTFLIALGVLFFGGIITLFAGGYVSLPDFGQLTASNEAPAHCNGRQNKITDVPARSAAPGGGALVEHLTGENSVEFGFNGVKFNLCLIEVLQEEGIPPRAVFGLRIDGKENYKFEARAEEMVTLSAEISELSSLGKFQIYVTPRVLVEGSVNAELEYEGAAEDTADANSTGQDPTVPDNTENTTDNNATTAANDEIIQVTMKFTERSFIKWVDDGNGHPGVTVPAGVTRILEAKNRLRIRIGNAGGVRIGRGGKLEVAGPKNKIMNYLYERVPDPYDSTRTIIKVSRGVTR